MFYRNGIRFKLHPLTSSENITARNGEQINLIQQGKGEQGMSWSVKKGSVDPSSYTKIDENGNLYVGLGQVAGTLIVEGTLDDATAQATVTIEVENVTPNVPNAKCDNSKAGSRQFTIKAGTRTITDGKWSLVKTHSTQIGTNTKIAQDGTLSWDRTQASGQIGISWTKDGITKAIAIVFAKASASIKPSTATVKNGASQQFTIE